MPEQPVEVDPLAAIVVVDVDPGPVRRDEIVRVSRVLTRPDRVMKLERLMVALQLIHHGEERRDADAAGDEQVFAGALLDREEIDGVADDELVPTPITSCRKREPPRPFSSRRTLIM